MLAIHPYENEDVGKQVKYCIFQRFNSHRAVTVMYLTLLNTSVSCDDLAYMVLML